MSVQPIDNRSVRYRKKMADGMIAGVGVGLKFSINSDASDVTVCSKCIQLMYQLE